MSTLTGGHVIAVIRSVGLSVSDNDVDQRRRGYREVFNGSICAEHISGVPRGGWGVQTPPEIPKALQNCAKLNPICENC